MSTLIDHLIHGDYPTEKSPNPKIDFAGWLRTCKEEVLDPIEPVSITGEMPSWVQGSLLRNGGGKMQIGDMKFKHIFDSLSLMHRYEIKNGKVTYQRRFLQSQAYQKDMAANRIVVSEFGTTAVPDPCQSIFRKVATIFEKPGENSSDNAMISIYPFNDEYFAFTESPVIHRIDPKTLETKMRLNVFDYVGIVSHTSHPHVDLDGSVYNVGLIYKGGSPYYAIMKFPHGQNMFKDAKIAAQIPVRWKFNPSYMHSFGITENYFIIVEQPFCISVAGMAIGAIKSEPIASALRWYEGETTNFLLIDRKTGKLVKTYYSESFFYFHTINQYEKDGHIFLDISCYRDAKMLNCLYVDSLDTAHDNLEFAKKIRNRPLRFVLPLDNDNGEKSANCCSFFGSNEKPEKFLNLVTAKNTKARVYAKPDGSLMCEPELLTDIGVETPRFNNDKYLGREYRYFYGITADIDLDTPGSLIKVDTMTKTRKLWYEDGRFASEPIFVPHPNARTEDHGVVLAAILSVKDDSFVSLLVLDGETFQEIGRFDFRTPGPTPKCLHGWFANKV